MRASASDRYALRASASSRIEELRLGVEQRCGGAMSALSLSRHSALPPASRTELQCIFLETLLAGRVIGFRGDHVSPALICELARGGCGLSPAAGPARQAVFCGPRSPAHQPSVRRAPFGPMFVPSHFPHEPKVPCLPGDPSMPCRVAFRPPTSSLHRHSGRRTHRSAVCARSARAGQLR